MKINRFNSKFLFLLLSFLLTGIVVQSQNLEDLTFGTDSTLEVMTWNIEWFPKNGNTTVNYVTNIILALDVDVLAIQEIDDIGKFEQLLNNLPEYEGYLKSSWFAGLAYIYKPSVIHINQIFEIYTTAPYWSPFPRSPMVMDFTYQDERFILINNHFKCCGDGLLNLGNPDDEETRRYTANNLLKEYVDTYFPNENVIVMGDLNDDIADVPQHNVFQLTIDDSENYLFTDMAIAKGPLSEWSYPTWPSHLDHILISNELFSHYEPDPSIIKTIKIDDYLAGGWQEYEENISDHRPVALKLDMNANIGSTNLTEVSYYMRAFPNPFHSKTSLYTRYTGESMELEILNLHGKIVFSEMLSAQQSTLTWNAHCFSEGIYIAILKSNNKTLATLKLVLMK